MGDRSEAEIFSDMISSDIPEDQARKISKGADLKGESAKVFVKNNKTDIGEITSEQQIELFNLIYPSYVKRAIKNYENWTNGNPEKVAWSELSDVIKDVLVDFVYQGFTKGPKPMEAGMRKRYR